MATVPDTETGHDADHWTKPPFLRRVRIEGYKSIAFCNVALQPLTILVGRNAAGKSNFIDALAFLRDVVAKGVHEAVKLHGGLESIPCRLRSDPRVILEVECDFPQREKSGRWTARYRLEIEFPKKKAPHLGREHLRLQTADSIWWTEYTVEQGRVTRDENIPSLHTIQEWGNPDRVLLSASASPNSGVNEYGVPPFVRLREGLETLETYNFNPDAIRSTRKPLPGVFLEKDGSNLASVIETTGEIDENTIRRIGLYLSSVSQAVEAVRVVRYGEYETVRFRMRAKENGTPVEFDAVDVSDGTLRALAALVAAFQTVLPFGHPGLVAIEEPEAALHPAAMRALVDALEEATQHTQILLTTHSPDLLADPDLDPSSVLVVRNHEGLSQITPVDPASRESVRKELYTLADLQRMDQLDIDAADLERQEQASRRNGKE
jgi:predicted ATPase